MPSPPPVPARLGALLLASLLGLAAPARAHDGLPSTLARIAEATARRPEDAALWLERAELARLAGDHATAGASLDRAQTLGAAPTRLALCRAALLLDERRPDAAAHAALGALALDPTADEAARAELLLARARAATGRDEEALAAYARALALAPHPSADVALERATLALAGGRVGEAARGLDEALARLPFDRALLDTRALLGPATPPHGPARRSAPPRGGPAAAPEAAPAAAAVLTRGPYLQNARPDSITLRWRTDVATDSRVWAGSAPATLTLAALDAVPSTEHEVRIGGLSPATTRFYAVGSIAGPLAGGDSAHAFTTPPLPGDPAPTRIWVLGDSGEPGAAQDRVRDAYAAFSAGRPTDVWLMLGDNAYSTGTDAEYQAGLFTPYASFLRGHCLWSTRGNHDAIHSGGANDYYDLFTFPRAGEAGGLASSTEAWYSFDHGDIHFVCLDSEGSSRAPGSPMLTWLAADLAATPRRWVIAFWHHPPYTKGSHDSDDDADSGGRMRDMRANALPVLESYGVDLVLCGHSHSYERSYLLDGHYGASGTLTPGMILDGGDGRPAGDGAYEKPTDGVAPHEGEVVAVAGSSSKIGGGTLDHPAMFLSLNALGSMVIDVAGSELRGSFLDDLGAVRDSFVLRKGGLVAAEPRGAGLALAIAGANPARGAVRLALEVPRPGTPRVLVVDATGRRVRRLPVGPVVAGEHAVTWDRNDESGRRAPAGLYFAVLDFEGMRRVGRIVLLP